MGNDAIVVGVGLTTDRLTNDELVQLYNAVYMGADCSQWEWYSKVKSLFNQGQMHSATREALDEIVRIRLGGKA